MPASSLAPGGKTMPRAGNTLSISLTAATGGIDVGVDLRLGAIQVNGAGQVGGAGAQFNMAAAQVGQSIRL